MSLDELDLSVRSYNCLMRAGIRTVEDLCSQTTDDMIKIRNLGRRCLEEILQEMKKKGLRFSDKDTEQFEVESFEIFEGSTKSDGKREDQLGLCCKYNVSKIEDGSPVYNCFVLRPEKDPAAVIALKAYAGATQNQILSRDIYNWMTKIEKNNGLNSTDRP